jgi:hypothetical protein
MSLRLLPLPVFLAVGLLFPVAGVWGQTPTGDQLPDTAPLVLDRPLDVVMVEGINRFAERELAASRDRRAAQWNRDYSTPEAYQQSIEPNRQRLAAMLGAVDELVDPRPAMELPDLGEDDEIEDLYSGVRVRWDVLEGVTAEGRYLVPAQRDRHGVVRPVLTRAHVIVIPDSSQTPEELCGLAPAAPGMLLARRLVENGCSVLVVATLNRQDECSGHPDIRFTNIPHRELVYRCGFELGRHPIGYEAAMLRQARAVHVGLLGELEEWDDSVAGDRLPVGIAGIGDGGMLALYTAALDPEFDAAYVAGYFEERESIWRQPIDRNVFGLLTEFGDADLASLIAPRPLVIDNAPPPTWDGPPAARPGRAPFAAPGRITPPDPASVQREFARARAHYQQLGAAEEITLIPRRAGATGPISEEGLAAFLASLGIESVAPPGDVPPPAEVDLAALDAARQKRLVGSLVRHTQMLLHRSDKMRDQFWKEADRSSVERWIETSQKYRDHVHEHMIGRMPPPTPALNPRSRKVIDEPTHVGYEVLLDVYPGSPDPKDQRPGPDGGTRERTAAPALDSPLLTRDSSLIAGGILLLPRDLQPGERRPVVVCQHGLEGTPMDTITTDESTRAWGAYKGFSTQLVQRGFIVYAPQNPYRGEDEFRVIQRKSNPLGRSLFSYIIEQHRQTLRWLGTLPYVDPERIAFYGLSYGGKTAVRVPPLLLSPEPRAKSQEPGNGRAASDAPALDSPLSALHAPTYCLSICSADFNEWIRKNCSAEDRYSYVYTKEYEMFEWNMGHIAGYAELAALMAPRPFMVERGHHDGVAPDEWVGWEFAKVRRHYDLLGLGERTEIEWFNGPHTINGVGTFRFLHKHLNWPEPQ